MQDRQHKVMALVMEAGRTLLENGAEVFRVQQTMEIMAHSLGEEKFHVYVLTNGIFASVDGGIGAQVRNVPSQDTNLIRVMGVNEISRQVAAGEMTLEEAGKELERVKSSKDLPLSIQMFYCGLGSACFAVMFGGNFMDGMVALGVGMLLQTFIYAADRIKLSKIVAKMGGAAMVSLLAFLAWLLRPTLLMDKIIIGALMPLTPGIALTTSIRDFVNGDYLSGTIRMIDALLIAGSLACGVGLVLSVAQLLSGVAL